MKYLLTNINLVTVSFHLKFSCSENFLQVSAEMRAKPICQQVLSMTRSRITAVAWSWQCFLGVQYRRASAGISLAKNSGDMEKSTVILIQWHLATAGGEFIISTPLRMRKEGGVFVLILFAPSLLWATFLSKLNSCACMSASAADVFWALLCSEIL